MIAYVVPAYLLAGLSYPHNEGLNQFYIFIGKLHQMEICVPTLSFPTHSLGYMLLYLTTLHLLANALTSVFSSRHLASILLALILLCQALVTGYLIHSSDLPIWVSWIRYISPMYMMSRPMLTEELSPLTSVQCYHNPMVSDLSTGIIKQVCND